MKRLILAAVLLLCACSQDNPVPSSYVVDNYVDIYLKNEQGDNLLNTSEFNSNEFKIFYLLNGNAVEIYNPQMDAPRNFFIITETDPICMRLFLNDVASESFPITYIKWNETDTDTLKASFLRGENYVRCSGVWLNDELVWDQSTPSEGTGRSITIVK